MVDKTGASVDTKKTGPKICQLSTICGYLVDNSVDTARPLQYGI